MKSLPSEFDINTFPMHRDFINEFINQVSEALLNHNSSTHWMEVGRQEQDFIKKKFSNRTILTFDMVDKYKPDLVGDLTLKNQNIPSGSFGGIFCMEVLVRFPRFFVFQEVGVMLPVSLSVEQ